MLPDFGWTELMVISIVLIVVIGPKDLPKLLRGFGQTMTSVRRMAGDFRKQFDDALKEAELDDVRQLADDMRALDPRSQIKEALNPLADVGREIDADVKKAMSDIDQPALPKNPELPKSPPQVGLDQAGDKARAAQANKRKPSAKPEAASAAATDAADAASATKAAAAKTKAPAKSAAKTKTAQSKAAQSKTARPQTAKSRAAAKPASGANGAAASGTTASKTASKTKAPSATAAKPAARKAAAKPRKTAATRTASKTTTDDAGGSS